MTFKEFVDLFSSLKNAEEERRTYIDSIPNDISAAIYDNKYVASYERIVDKLISAAFPENVVNDVDYFLYTHKYSSNVAITVTDEKGHRKYVIECLSDTIAYFLTEYTWGDS